MKIAPIVALALALAACGGAPDSSGATQPGAASFPESAYAMLSSDGGKYHVEVRTAPSQPPVRGELQAELRVYDASGAPAPGLAVTVVPWMPAHGHGASVLPTTTDEGGGAYLIDRLDLYMAGEWELRMTVGGESAQATLDVQ